MSLFIWTIIGLFGLFIWTIAGFFGIIIYAHTASDLRYDNKSGVLWEILFMLLMGPIGWAMLASVLIQYMRG
jgi:hypothetical protein